MIIDGKAQEVQRLTDKLYVACMEINPLYNVFLAHCLAILGSIVQDQTFINILYEILLTTQK